jgi:16S rRNA (cytidine1402-2'-O)-methyltransferase
MIPRELNFEGTSPLLYLIATPIGNLSEMTPRAIEVLKDCDYIAAEDTRNSGQLMAHFGIDKPFISCHEHNEETASEKIVALLKQGKKVCYMSDAGYPTLSDPGERLVAKCLSNGIKVSVTSGPSAAIDALAVSGLPSDHFYFEGFLPAKPSERDHELQELSSRVETIIFYESPHRILETLKALDALLGDRPAVLCRELTKAHEEIIRGTLHEFVSLDETSLRGEMVILVHGAIKVAKVLDENDITSLLKSAIKEGLSSKDAIAKVASENDLAKNVVYQVCLKNVK